ncbi:MAG TPA: methylmalonyl Co-A mutase-associated GTPase MeaB [Edaphobacter sp.]|nr:methylmalonyl Co-A mutase-associated GTPase MeaB [Edaphobacter sp.]
MSKDSNAGQHEITQMIGRLRTGDLRALARAISIVEDGGAGAADLVTACRVSQRNAIRIGITGSPGAGKSTLVDQMARSLSAEGQSVGVIALDPSSPYTGGALLGDRIRMQGFAAEARVFIRSMATRGAMGGVARSTADVCTVMEAAGRQTILIETVGVGQDEVDVIGVADVTLLVLMPGMGDEVQSLKAGVMEIADIFVVNKSDRGGAELVEQEIVAMQALSLAHGEWVPPVIRTVAITGDGVPALMEAVRQCAELKRTRRVRIGSASLTGGLRLDHLGVAVKSIAEARRFYEALGLTMTREETVEYERVKTAMLPLGETRIELLEPAEEDSTIAKFITKRGEGLHHIAVQVEDVDSMFSSLTAQGMKLASDTVRVGAGGHRYFFVHPASTGGVLLEIVGEGAPSGEK